VVQRVPGHTKQLLVAFVGATLVFSFGSLVSERALPVRYTLYTVAHLTGRVCVCVDIPPCKIHTVYIWRISPGGGVRCTRYDQPPTTIPPSHDWYGDYCRVQIYGPLESMRAIDAAYLPHPKGIHYTLYFTIPYISLERMVSERFPWTPLRICLLAPY
jgi:hypothetical protein